MDDHLSSIRYEPPPIDLANKNISHTLTIELIGFNKKILEIGTSTGYVSKILKERGNTVTGIEIDREAGSLAGQYCDRVIIGDVEDLDLDAFFDPQSYDIILCADILEHLKKPATLLKKILKYLKPDGYLVVSLPNFCHGDVILNLLLGDFRYSPVGLLDETHIRFFGLKNIFSLFADCGYQISDICTTTADLGTTELKIVGDIIPPDLFNFIKSLPDSNVYQYVFTAHPSHNVQVPGFKNPDLNQLLNNSREEIIREVQVQYTKLIEEQNLKIQELQMGTTRLTATIQNKTAEVSRLQERVSALISDLDEKNSENKNLKETLDSIHQSILWTISKKFQNFLDSLFPLGKKRTALYQQAIQGGRVLLYEGLRTYGFRFKQKNYRRFISRGKTSTPVIETDIHGLSHNQPRSLIQPLRGVFICPINELCEIQILTATFNRKNSDLILRLREGSFESQIIQTIQLPASHISNNQFTEFRFSSIPQSSGKKYCFEIQSQSSPAAAVWYNPKQTVRQLQLYDENGPIAGIVGFRCFSKIQIDNPYEAWILANEPHRIFLEQLTKDQTQFQYHPKISIITPVWNTDERWLRKAIESVIDQVYDNWELCIVDGGSTKSHIKSILKEYAEKEPRIKIQVLAENKGISGNSNAALAMATGDFVGFLDHDDELTPLSLYTVVEVFDQNRDVNFVYSDEDKIDEKDIRQEPFFKPDWSPDMFLSHNYLCHFSVIRKSLVDTVGGFREGYDGAQDYDLFLRVTEKILPSTIVHIPKILYHWRMIQGSAAGESSAKPYAFTSAKKALADALQRRKTDGDVQDGLFPSSYRICYSICGNPPVSIIIPTKDNVDVLKRCVSSILEKTTYDNYEILLIDNQSIRKETFDYYEHLKPNLKIRILSYDKPFNYSAINNFAVTQATSPYILFLNNDTEVISGEWLIAMLEHAQRENIGAVGAKLLYPNNTVQHAGVVIGIMGNPPIGGHAHRHLPYQDHGYFGRADNIQNVSAVTAACLLMKKEIFEKIGGFEEELAIAFNDVDLCLKIRDAGYLIVYTPYALLYHHESLSRGSEDTVEKLKRFEREVMYIRSKWRVIFEKGDPYYNRNLTTDKEDFSIRI